MLNQVQYRSFVPPPHVKPAKDHYNEQLCKSIKAICDYCLHIAKTYRFDMEPDFDSDWLSPVSREVIFKFKAPSKFGADVDIHTVRISGKIGTEYTLQCVKYWLKDDVLNKYNDIKTYNSVVKSMMSAVDHSLIGCDKPTNIAGIICQTVTPLPIKTERY